MIVLGLALLLASTWAPGPGPGPTRPEQAANRHRLAQVTLIGPLEEARFLVEPMGAGIVRAGLQAGERRSLLVPLPVWGSTDDLVPRVEVQGTGQARFEGWAGENAAADRAWAALPRGLRRRPRPAPPLPAPARAPTTALLVAAAALAGAWSLRARPGRSLLVSLAGAVCVVPLVTTRAPAPALRVLEGDGASGTWVVVDAARERIEAALETRLLRVECQPPRAPLTFTRDLGAPGTAHWTLAGERCVLFVLSQPSTNLGALRAGANELGDLDAVWVRAADGSGWDAVGAWPEGSVLPGPLRPEDPPGSLNPALPLGTRVLVGRLAPGTPGGRDPGWVRLVGL